MHKYFAWAVIAVSLLIVAWFLLLVIGASFANKHAEDTLERQISHIATSSCGDTSTGTTTLSGEGVSAIVTSEGGTISVDDPRSKIFGTSVSFPPGAVLSPETIRICYAEPPSLILDTEGPPWGEAASKLIVLQREKSGLQENFHKAIKVTIPYDSSTNDMVIALVRDSSSYPWRMLIGDQDRVARTSSFYILYAAEYIIVR